MTKQPDVVVLGLGTGGEELAGRLALAGLDVVGIEPELVGGECAYWACIPTKMIVRAANLLQEARRVDGVAGRVSVQPDWAPVAARIREHATGNWDDSLAVQRFEGRGGRFVRGRGRLVGPRTVEVDGTRFTPRRGVVIATGSRPAVPPIPGLAEVSYWTSRDAVGAQQLPSSLVVLGGGAVGCELGQAFARFGVRVTIVEGGERLLRAEEPEVGDLLAEVFRSEGITVHAGARAERIRPSGAGVTLELDNGLEITAERLLVAVGRRPAIEDLGLDRAGISTTGSSIPVDERMRAGDGIWAIGDATGKGLFTHVALYQAPIAEADILGEEIEPADYATMPRVTFSDPEVAAVGMSEAAAREAGIDAAVTVKALTSTFRGWIHGTGNAGLIKLVADRRTGTLRGATVVGPQAGEVLGLLAAAVRVPVPVHDLRRMIYPFPTFHGGAGEAMGAYARALVQVLDPDAQFLLVP